MFIDVPSRHRARLVWATPMLVLVSVGVFLWLVTRAPETRLLVLERWGAVPELLSPSGRLDLASLRQLLTLATALLIHADWLHLVGNLLFLLIFGLPAERALGGGRLLALFLLGGVVANLSAVFALASSRSVIVGSSGAVSALIGAYLVLFPRARLGFVVPLGLFLEFVRTPAPLMIGVWAALQLAFTVVGPGFGAVAWSAHAAGFAYGLLHGALSRGAVRRRHRGA
ncbi:rhomboid family intramembrane serine protease [Pseudomarimonas salicorniae]|uniref:Rhomboid family intramembrane serine protease n=1 Tax=Pseudomarimonas salicorniae TaxID=2933270 RepID=A0ABT0GJ35_9GAMM|nr:rhomboid family intramembrane serine protease [Lysobacter sp. CAU 1642]MCK7594433.1 rhomboid family intramembrane serine protease [Lysobacter sp. CAU 1642]